MAKGASKRLSDLTGSVWAFWVLAAEDEMSYPVEATISYIFTPSFVMKRDKESDKKSAEKPVD